MNDKSAARFVVDVVQLSPKRAEPQKIDQVRKFVWRASRPKLGGAFVFFRAPSGVRLIVGEEGDWLAFLANHKFVHRSKPPPFG